MVEKQFQNEELYSKKVRAGKRRTYFFDVRTTRSNDYYVTITESKKRFNGDGFERHKIHLYKEDFNKFVEAMNELVNHVKTVLMPEFDFDKFNHLSDEEYDRATNDGEFSSDEYPKKEDEDREKW